MVELLPAMEQVTHTVRVRCHLGAMEEGSRDILRRVAHTDRAGDMEVIHTEQVPHSSHDMDLLDMVAWGEATAKTQ